MSDVQTPGMSYLGSGLGGKGSGSRGQVPGPGLQPVGTPRVAAGCRHSQPSPSVRRSGESHGICGEREPEVCT